MIHPQTIPFTEALLFWLKLGFISFGGPAGQIAIMHRELVEERRWITESRFLHALNYCMVLPGPEAQQLATYIGWLMHGTRGGLAAGVLFVLPSLLILIALSWIYAAFGHVTWVAGILYGIKPAVAALVVQALHRMGSKTLKKPSKAPVLWAVAASSFVAIHVFQVAFPWIVLGAGFIGWAMQKSTATESASPTLTPSVFSRQALMRCARVVGIGLALWLLPVAALVAWQGWDSTLVTMAWFFTKAALLTFGGAYAVLPYVYQGAVEQFHWLTAAQMMDGLALGETTPGPLIMVVAFIGFVGGWAKEVLGANHLFWGGALAACVVTWFTFLPSFIFIFAGAPLVESTHNQPAFTAPLTAITAAVVGVIASLALFFIANTAYVAGVIDGFSVMVMLAAMLALVRYRVPALWVIAGCAGAGWLSVFLSIR